MQYGDGRERETETSTRTSTSDSSSGDDQPAPRRPLPADGSDRLPAPLQYRDPERYEIVAEHGRGGLGRVFRARDKELGRDVALKELLSRGSTSELRFFREALITARLEHPGIVPVHEAGRWPDGTPFYAMKLVAGRPLKALIDECKTLEDRLALLPHVIAVADAIAYAHDRKIIHRDLKPSNIIVGDFGETVVIDWGLAKDISDQAPAEDVVEDGPFRTAATAAAAGDGVTVAGTVVGTPAYMSPEQARGEQVDERTDVYALGAILCELTCNTGPRDLSAIARACMAASPSERYPSARGVATDLRQFSSGARVNAQNYSAARLLWLWVHRHRTRAIAFVAAFAAASITALFALSSVLTSRDRAERSRIRAEAASLRSGEERLKALHALAELTLTNDPTEAAAVARQLPESPSSELLRSRAAAAGIATHTLRFSSGIYNVTLLPDHTRALVLTSDRRMQMVHAHTGSVEVIADHLTMPARVSAHGDRLIYAMTSDSYQLVERDAGGASTIVASLNAMPIEVAHTGAAVYWVTADGQLVERSLSNSTNTIVATAVANLAGRGEGVVWCSRAGELFGRQQGQQQKLAACRPEIQFAAMGDYLVFAETASSVGLVGPDNRLILTTPSATSPQPDIDFHVSDSGLVALADASKQGAFIRPGSRELSPVPIRFNSPPSTTAAGGSLTMWGFDDGTVLAFDTSTASLWVHQAHDSVVGGILVTRSDAFFTFSTNTLRIWSMPTRTATVVAKASPRVFNPTFGPDSTQAILDSSTGKAVIVSLRTRPATAVSLHEHQGIAFSAAWCGAFACTGGWDSTVRCSDPTSGARRVIETTGPVRWMVGAADRCYYVAATGGAFDIEQGEALYAHKSEPTRIAYAEGHGLLASIDVTGTALTYDVNRGRIIATRADAHSAPVPILQWEGKTLWSAGLDGNVRRWDEALQPLESHRFRGPTTELAVTPTHLFVAHSSTVLWLRDRLAGAEVELDLRAPISAIGISPHGHHVVVSTHTGEIHVLDASTAESLRTFRTSTDIREMRFAGDTLIAVGHDGSVLSIPVAD